MNEAIKKGLTDSAELKLALCSDKYVDIISEIVKASIDTISRGGKIIIAGNGGSAADAQHIAAELVGRYLKDRKAIAALALTTDTSSMTAIANDLGFEKIFSRQIDALGNRGDLFLAISTSGESANLVEAIKSARQAGLFTVSFLGKGGGRMGGLADIDLTVPSGDTPRIQEAHITIGHLVCEAIENKAGTPE
ncbi:Phosphoheptose isomerase 1 [hydrothermal vent metagenome]|uniref:D-sedoheptulose-7-phosphate isomerase n=1 Tax=hydrothermal vent metagenome TaxID=652676 RepID=A0A3B1CGN4_9ZZZZ